MSGKEEIGKEVINVIKIHHIHCTPSRENVYRIYAENPMLFWCVPSIHFFGYFWVKYEMSSLTQEEEGEIWVLDKQIQYMIIMYHVSNASKGLNEGIKRKTRSSRVLLWEIRWRLSKKSGEDLMLSREGYGMCWLQKMNRGEKVVIDSNQWYRISTIYKRVILLSRWLAMIKQQVLKVDSSC